MVLSKEKKEKQTRSGDKCAISKKSTSPWVWPQHIFFLGWGVGGSIFTVMFVSWQEDCDAVVESTFQQKETRPALHATSKNKMSQPQNRDLSEGVF